MGRTAGPAHPSTEAAKSEVIRPTRDGCERQTGRGKIAVVVAQLELVYTAEEATRRPEAFRADIALLDIALPGMSGYKLHRALRAMSQLKKTPLVAVTGLRPRRRPPAAPRSGI